MTAQRKCFMTVVENRDQQTLLRTIERYIIPGSIVRTDCWAAYQRMVDLNMDLIHQTVNHSRTFRDREVHTNTIEDELIT